MTVTTAQLEAYLRGFLKPDSFEDYGPNGLQVQGHDNIERVAFAVSATRDSITQAIEQRAQALVVHHGLFWKFHGAKTLTGPFYQRVAPLIKNDLSLFGYHLPLDAHPEVGNARALADLLGMENHRPFGDHKGMPTGLSASFKEPLSPDHLASKIEKVCRHSVIVSRPPHASPIKTMGIITGGANGDWTLAVQEGLDAYLTGEISEHDWHEAGESGITMFAAGHHATEQFGIQSLMAHLQKKFSLHCFYLDSDNPA